MNKQLTKVPRVESQAPNKNTIEWEIPDKVLVSYMLVGQTGYTFIIKVKQQKKHFWNKLWKTFTVIDADPGVAIMKGVEKLEKYGYTIDSDTIQFGEKVGSPDYFNNR